MISGIAEVYYIDTDQLDTPRLIQDASNTPVWRWDREPFGATPANDDPSNTGKHFTFNLRFPGQYADVETGLNYNYFRDYDPNAGRYIESDLIGLAGGVNTYGYVVQRPLNAIDPTGKITFFDAAVGGLVGGIFNGTSNALDFYSQGCDWKK